MLHKKLWVNNNTIIKDNLNKKKPCHQLGYCPYGQFVELFLLRKKRSKKFSCKVFGHDCPVFYHAEDLSEFGAERIKKEMKEDGNNI